MVERRDANTKSFVLVQRQFRPVRFELHPFAAVALGLFALALLGWSFATTSYALFRDEFLMQIVSRHTASEQASSAEIARLKADAARASSRLLIEREEFTRKLGEFAERQTNIERKQELLSGLPEADAGNDNPGELRLRSPKPVRESRMDHGGTSGSLAEVERRFARIEKTQQRQMAALKSRLDRERLNLSRVYASLGLRSPEAPIKAGIGGLYIPSLPDEGLSEWGEPELVELQGVMQEAEHLRRGLAFVPVRHPAPQASQVSAFGNRVDPFLGTMAFHSGVDLDLPSGAPARTTASGTVVSAGWNGGYGLMVEVRHEQGFSTRYAHLSSVAVSEGDEVNVGDIVGRVGSTGRSTGPHLHYETRLNDRALDPRRFLAAAAMLGD